MIGFRKKRQEITLLVEGIHCNHCESSIKIALGKIPGVRKVRIRKRKQVVIEFESADQISNRGLRSIIENTGYTIKNFSETE